MADPTSIFNNIMARRGGGPAGPAQPGTPPPTPGPPGVPGPATQSQTGGSDPLADAIGQANVTLQGVIDGSVQVTPTAEQQLKVMMSLIQSIAQAAKQAAGQQSPPGGPAMSQVGPGTIPTSAPPGGLPPQGV